MKRWLQQIAVAACIAGLSGELWAEIAQSPPSRNRQVAFYVNHYLATQHLARKAPDDELSQRMLKTYIENLDPLKSYFLQSDIDRFNEQKTNLDDLLRNRDTQFAHDVFRVFLERVETRMKWIEELLAENNFDFTVDEEIVVEPDAMAYAKTDEEARDLWRRRIKYDLLVSKANNMEAEEARKSVLERYHTFAQRMRQADEDDVLERYMNALTTSYDPHTSYFSPNSFEDFRIRLQLNYEGIGAELDQKDGYAIIRRVLPGGAAAKMSELKANDRIVSVGQGDEGEMVDVMNMKLEHIIDMIRGHEGTVVRLGVLPEGAADMKVYKIVRQRIELEDSDAKSTIFEEGKKPDGKSYKVGVVDLPSFYLDMDAARNGDANYKSSTRDVRGFLEKFREEGVDVVVLDLRANGGGSLSEAIGITGLFVDQGPVVQVKDPSGEVEVQSDTESGAAWDGPLVVLTSRFSASASEIVAGAIQDYGRGLVVGDESTHGKGTVQSLLEVGPTVMKFENALNLGAVKLTMQQFYRPSGASTQNRGVLADVVLPSLSAEISKGESELDFALEFDEVKKSDYKVVGVVNEQLIEKLRQSSATRREQSSDFKQLAEKITRYREDSTRRTMPLNETKFLELRKQADAEKTEREQFDTLEHTGSDEVKRDFYLNEVLAIAAELAGELAGADVAAN